MGVCDSISVGACWRLEVFLKGVALQKDTRFLLAPISGCQVVILGQFDHLPSNLLYQIEEYACTCQSGRENRTHPGVKNPGTKTELTGLFC